MSYKRGNFAKITSGRFKGKTGQIIRREGNDVIILIDLDGDPVTPPIEVKVPKEWAKALKIINWWIGVLLPLLYGIIRK